MAVNKIKEKLRVKYFDMVRQFLTEQGEEVLQVGVTEFAIPCVDENGDDQYVTVKFSVPTGTKETVSGKTEFYDGYAMAEDFKLTQKVKSEKAKEIAKKKAEKIERDKAEREAKRKAKEERENSGG